MTASRKILIVVAHPDPASYNHVLARRTASALLEGGHKVTVVDLAAEGFRADIGPHDVTARADEARFHIQAEQAHAARHKAYSSEITRAQAQVAEADNLILQFPIWWGGPPALLKGWIDRVMSYGFAYVDGRRFETGLLQGRRALISVTTGGTEARFSDDGIYGPIDPLLMPVRRLALEYVGFEVEPIQVAYGVARQSQEVREDYIAGLVQAALTMAAKPAEKSDAWKTAIDEVPEAAWARNK